MVDGDMMFMQF